MTFGFLQRIGECGQQTGVIAFMNIFSCCKRSRSNLLIITMIRLIRIAIIRILSKKNIICNKRAEKSPCLFFTPVWMRPYSSTIIYILKLATANWLDKAERRLERLRPNTIAETGICKSRAKPDPTSWSYVQVNIKLLDSVTIIQI